MVTTTPARTTRATTDLITSTTASTAMGTSTLYRVPARRRPPATTTVTTATSVSLSAYNGRT